MFDGNKYSNIEILRHNGMNSIKTSTISSSVVTPCIVFSLLHGERISRFVSDSGKQLQKHAKCRKLLIEMKPILVRLSLNGFKD